jgi:type I restriction enzyme M protein
MSNGDFNWIANFIWGIADDVLCDLYVRGKYRDVVLPMTILRRRDAVLDLRHRASLAQLKADFEAYLDGFSPNVQEILDNFEFRNQLPKPVLNGDGAVRHAGLDNHAMAAGLLPEVAP